MASSPTHKNLDVLVEQPDSGQIVCSKQQVKLTKIFVAKRSVVEAALKPYGTIGTGDTEGYVIETSTSTPMHGDQAKLVDVWLAGGPDADPEVTPLPPDEYGLGDQDLNPSTEKNKNFALAVADPEVIKLVRAAGLIADESASDTAYQQLVSGVVSTGDKYDQGRLLADLLRRSVTNFYQASFVYQWAEYSYGIPFFDVGGYIDVPGGPLGSLIDALGLVCLRKADTIDYTNGAHKNTHSWICAIDSQWEQVLYDPTYWS